MTKRNRIRETRLSEIENEFSTLLFPCLRECARGRWGLFGQNDLIAEGQYYRYYRWPEAERLRELAQEIQLTRLPSGQPNEVCERFLQLCSMRGSNIPGEPRLAAELLASIDQNDPSQF